MAQQKNGLACRLPSPCSPASASPHCAPAFQRPTIPAYCHKPAWLADMINTRPNRAFGRLLGTDRPHAWPRPVPYPQAPSGLGLTALSPMPMDRGARRVEKGLCPPLQEAGGWHSGWARQTGADQLVSPSRTAEKSNNTLMKGK